MDWQTECRLIKGDSPTVVRYFEHRFLQFFNLVVKSPHKPIHEVTDYFMRIVCWMRNNTYSLLCLPERCPGYGHDPNETVADYYDQIISCSSDVPQEHKQYIEYQLHRHSKTCRVGNTHKYRFSFPVPPIECQSAEEEIGLKQKWRKIKRHLNQYGMALDLETTFDEMLMELEMTEDEYIKAVIISLVRPKLFLK